MLFHSHVPFLCMGPVPLHLSFFYPSAAVLSLSTTPACCVCVLVQFRSLGAALLDVAEQVPEPKRAHHKQAVGGTFARRGAADTHRMHFAAGKIQTLARKRSLERVRMTACLGSM